jgi:hypothetical protein
MNPMEIQTSSIHWLEMNYDTSISTAIIFNVKSVLNQTKIVDIEEFLWISIYDIWASIYLLEFNTELERDKVSEYLYSNFKPKNKISAQKLPWNRQTPENLCQFNYNQKYYIVINALNNITDEVNEKEWVYKWMHILNVKNFLSQKVQAKTLGVLSQQDN